LLWVLLSQLAGSHNFILGLFVLARTVMSAGLVT
jgi:hypothetical protein